MKNTPNFSRMIARFLWAFAFAAGAGFHGLSADLDRDVDRLFATWDKPGSPGAAVVIVRDARVVYTRGYGSANLEQGTPITPQTAFDVASVAKQFTGLGVSMLIQQGKLSASDDVHKYLPDVPDFGKAMTVGHLLRHTSGLRDWPETLLASDVSLEAPITLEMILEMVRRQRELDFAPGDEYQYSNTGYNLLAAIVGKVTGKPYAAWMRENVFQPLGMADTAVCVDPRMITPRRADSYAPDGHCGFREEISQLAAQGSSSLFVTAEDMGKWLVNFETGAVGGKAAIAAMLEPGRLNSGAPVDYGFGLGVGGHYRGAKTVIHTGSWAGFRSVVIRLPEKRFAVAILANVSNLDTVARAHQVTDLYLGDQLVPKPASASSNANTNPAQVAAAKLNPASWDAQLGTYRLGLGWLLTITREGDQLMAQATGEPRFKMTPQSDTKFFVEAYGAGVEFVREPDGAVTRLLYKGIHAPKLDLSTVTPGYLAAFAGDYWSEELLVTCRLELHDGKLINVTRDGERHELLAVGHNRFDGAGFAIEFTRAAGSSATEMKLSAGRVRRLRFKRVELGSKPLD